MDDAVNGRVLGEDVVEGLLVGDVDLVEVGATAAEQLDAVEGNLGRVVQAVDDDDIVAVLEEGQRRERANVARSTGHSLATGGGARRQPSKAAERRRAIWWRWWDVPSDEDSSHGHCVGCWLLVRSLRFRR